MKRSGIVGKSLVDILRTRQVIDNVTSEPVKKWARKQKGLPKKISRQRKLLGR